METASSAADRVPGLFVSLNPSAATSSLIDSEPPPVGIRPEVWREVRASIERAEASRRTVERLAAQPRPWWRFFRTSV